jgi:hypothetical protein
MLTDQSAISIAKSETGQLILLAFWVSGSDRVYALAQRTYLILFWVGFLALFRGFSQIMLAFTIRHAGEEAAAIDPAGPYTLTTRPQASHRPLARLRVAHIHEPCLAGRRKAL